MRTEGLRSCWLVVAWLGVTILRADPPLAGGPELRSGGETVPSEEPADAARALGSRSPAQPSPSAAASKEAPGEEGSRAEPAPPSEGPKIPPPAESEAPPAESEAPPAESEASPAESEASPAESEASGPASAPPAEASTSKDAKEPREARLAEILRPGSSESTGVAEAAAPTSPLVLLLRLAASLAAVLAVFVGLLLFYRRFVPSARRAATSSTGQLERVDRLSLGTRQSVELVRIGEEIFALARSGDRLELLTRLDPQGGSLARATSLVEERRVAEANRDDSKSEGSLRGQPAVARRGVAARRPRASSGRSRGTDARGLAERSLETRLEEWRQEIREGEGPGLGRGEREELTGRSEA